MNRRFFCYPLISALFERRFLSRIQEFTHYSLKDVQEWMGHADIAVTANIYGHLEIQRKLDMAAKMSRCIDQ